MSQSSLTVLAYAGGSTRTLVPSYSTLCRPAFIPAPRLSQAFIRWGFGTVPGFAWIRCASFKPFGPLALVQQALAAIIFAALCRFRGPALFHGLRPSSRLGAPFWPSGLTVRRSRPPTAAAELRALAPRMSRKVEIAIGAAGVLIGSALMMSGKAMCRTSCWVDDIFRYLLPNNLASLAGGIPWVLMGFAIIVWSLWRGPK